MGLCVPVHLVSRGRDGLCFRLSFKVCLHSKQPWKVEIVSLPKAGHVCLLPVNNGESSEILST